MKNLIWSLILVVSSVSVCKAQKVFSVEYENQNDIYSVQDMNGKEIEFNLDEDFENEIIEKL